MSNNDLESWFKPFTTPQDKTPHEKNSMFVVDHDDPDLDKNFFKFCLRNAIHDMIDDEGEEHVPGKYEQLLLTFDKKTFLQLFPNGKIPMVFLYDNGGCCIEDNDSFNLLPAFDDDEFWERPYISDNYAFIDILKYIFWIWSGRNISYDDEEMMEEIFDGHIEDNVPTGHFIRELLDDYYLHNQGQDPNNQIDFEVMESTNCFFDQNGNRVFPIDSSNKSQIISLLNRDWKYFEIVDSKKWSDLE